MHLPSSSPHYLLFSSSDAQQKTWRFALCTPNGVPILEAVDREPEAQADRLALLPVVLGLEALEQPSKITLCTPSRYVQEGIRFGLAEWQANGWQWEYFGQMVPVKNRDLWQRVERAMRYHQVECRWWRWDPPHKSRFGSASAPPVNFARRPSGRWEEPSAPGGCSAPGSLGSKSWPSHPFLASQNILPPEQLSERKHSGERPVFGEQSENGGGGRTSLPLEPGAVIGSPEGSPWDNPPSKAHLPTQPQLKGALPACGSLLGLCRLAPGACQEPRQQNRQSCSSTPNPETPKISFPKRIWHLFRRSLPKFRCQLDRAIWRCGD